MEQAMIFSPNQRWAKTRQVVPATHPTQSGRPSSDQEGRRSGRSGGAGFIAATGVVEAPEEVVEETMSG